MNRGNFFRRCFIALIGMIFALNAAVAHAEIYTGEGSYVMSKAETLEVACERAKADAMRNATEKAGVYVKSYSRSKNFELEEDIIETMTANILKLVENPHFDMPEKVNNLEGILIHVIVKVQIDDSDITRWLNKSEQEKSTLVSQMEALRKAYDEQARIIEDLKRQLANNPQDTKKITQEFADADKIFLSNQKVEEGWNIYSKGDFNGAKNLFDSAVQLNPNNAGAYFGRGTSYDDLGQEEHAIADYTKAIELKPNYAKAYNNRGNAYQDINQYERAIQDYNKAIELNLNYDYAYNNRGVAYDNLGQYERAIQDYDKAIQLNPNYTNAYLNRGVAYRHLNQYERAILDYNKTIELNPKYDIVYNNRGWVYYCMKNYHQALKDFEKALELNPNNMQAKNNLKLCYEALGK